MVSADVELLFLRVIPETDYETIDICANIIYDQQDVIRNLLSLATKESCFILNEVLNKRKDGVAMGSPLGPTSAKTFLCIYERKWLKKYPIEFKPVFYSNQRIFSKNFVASLIIVTLRCRFHLRKKKRLKCYFRCRNLPRER